MPDQLRKKKSASKRLTAITELAFDDISQDLTRPEYRQGGTLGDDLKHWFWAKFFQQYRLLFLYYAPSKVIVRAWVNDKDTKLTKTPNAPTKAATTPTWCSARCWEGDTRLMNGIGIRS